MLYFLDELSPNSTIDCDVCIIGSGFAGLAIAKRLHQEKKLKILVAEGSSSWHGTISAHHPAPHPQEQQLYQGSLKGWIKKADPQYLLTSRLRTLGGSSSVWSGWTLTLEEGDLTRHKSHPWPISYDELSSYYPDAKRFLNLSDGDYDRPQDWISACPYEDLDLFPSERFPLRTRILQLNPIRLQHHYIKLFLDKVDLYRNAHLVELCFSSSSSEKIVHEARFLTSKEQNQHSLKIKARCFVLATGALETTRQLLMAGIKNKWLGRNFVEHPYIWQAASFSHALMPQRIKRFYDASQPLFRRDGSGFIGMLVPKDTWLRDQKMGSFRVLLYIPQGSRGWLNLSFEQLPHDKPSISLAKEKDIFGNPLLHLDSHLCTEDYSTIDCALNTTCEFLKDKKFISSVNIPHPTIIPGFHPAGTTRMGTNSFEGVVDNNCKVYGTNNLFIASSSVFPSCGYANPTLTIIAMAERLADHLMRVCL